MAAGQLLIKTNSFTAPVQTVSACGSIIIKLLTTSIETLYSILLKSFFTTVEFQLKSWIVGLEMASCKFTTCSAS